VPATGRHRAQRTALEGALLEQAAGRFNRLNEPTFHCHAVEIALDEDAAAVGAAPRDIVGQTPHRLPFDAPPVARFLDTCSANGVSADG
jgi:hypothetical protein